MLLCFVSDMGEEGVNLHHGDNFPRVTFMKKAWEVPLAVYFLGFPHMSCPSLYYHYKDVVDLSDV